MINHGFEIERQILDKLPDFLDKSLTYEIERKLLDKLPNFLDKSPTYEIEQYYENLYILTKYLHRLKRKMRQNKLKIKCLTLYNENKVK